MSRHTYAAIAESDLLDWASMFLSSAGPRADGGPRPGAKVTLAPRNDRNGLVIGQTRRVSPWRIVMLARQAADLLTNELVAMFAAQARTPRTRRSLHPRHPRQTPCSVPLIFIPVRSLLIILLFACSLSLQAKPSEWTNVLGNSFKGEPLQALGPMALFRTSSGRVRWELFRSLSVETVQRFYREAKLADPAPRWADTKAYATAELVGRASLLGADGEWAKADFTKVPEPQLLLVL